MAERISSEDFESKVLKNGKLVLVDFYSDSCVPCKRMSPLLAELEESYADKLYVSKVNIAYDIELVERYEVTSAPTLIFFKGGEQIERLTGVQKKAQLEEIINANA
jgi:thioredoxin 1